MSITVIQCTREREKERKSFVTLYASGWMLELQPEASAPCNHPNRPFLHTLYSSYARTDPYRSVSYTCCLLAITPVYKTSYRVYFGYFGSKMRSPRWYSNDFRQEKRRYICKIIVIAKNYTFKITIRHARKKKRCIKNGMLITVVTIIIIASFLISNMETILVW